MVEPKAVQLSNVDHPSMREGAMSSSSPAGPTRTKINVDHQSHVAMNNAIMAAERSEKGIGKDKIDPADSDSDSERTPEVWRDEDIRMHGPWLPTWQDEGSTGIVLGPAVGVSGGSDHSGVSAPAGEAPASLEGADKDVGKGKASV